MKVIIITLFLLIGMISKASTDTSRYETPDYTKITKVYKIKDRNNSVSVLRLYEDSTYEFLCYDETYYTCKKAKGKYSSAKKYIQLKEPFYKDKKFNEFIPIGKFYRNEKGLYSSLKKFLLNNRPDYSLIKRNQYKHPWFFYSDNLLVKSYEIIPETDIKMMIKYVLTDVFSEKEKFKSLANFIVKNINYGNAEKGEKNCERILFGKRKNAVCEGYSRTYEYLCQLAGLECKYVYGPVRTSSHEIIYINVLHAWNQIKLNGQWHEVDVTWMESNDYWFMTDRKEFALSHFENNIEDRLDSMSVDSFTSSPVIQFIKKGSTDIKTKIKGLEPLQFLEGDYSLTLPVNQKIKSIYSLDPSAMWVSFKGENFHPSNKFKKVKPVITTSQTEQHILVPLEDTVNLFQLEIEGIGTAHVLIFNGDKKNVYQWFINHWNSKSLISSTYALMASILLKDKEAFENISGNNKQTAYKNALEDFENLKLEQWNFLTYEAAHNISYTDSEKNESHSMHIDTNGNEIVFLRNNKGDYHFYEFDKSLFKQYAQK